MHEMYPHLWQGSIVDSLRCEADMLLTCSLEGEASTLRERALHILFPFADAPVLPDMELAHQIAALLAHEVALGRDTLVHCTAGKNRSGLMVALVLQHLGVAKGQALVDYVRVRNVNAFTAPGDGGPYFARYLAGEI